MKREVYQRATSRTRRKIQSAFAELLAEHGAINNISVTDLAERAEITRGTFYNYYNNIHEVVVELQNEIEKRLFGGHTIATIGDIERYIDDAFLFLKQQESIYRELITSNASVSFLEQFENEMSQSVLAVMHKNGINGKETDLDLLLLTSGAIAIVRKYYQGKTQLTLDEIRDYLKQKLRHLLAEAA